MVTIIISSITTNEIHNTSHISEGQHFDIWGGEVETIGQFIFIHHTSVIFINHMGHPFKWAVPKKNRNWVGGEHPARVSRLITLL